MFNSLSDAVTVSDDEMVAALGRVLRRSAALRHQRRWRDALVAAGVGVVAVSVIAATGLVGPDSRPTPAWTLVADSSAVWGVVPSTGLAMPHLTCPSATTCYNDSYEGGVDLSTDGAVTWHSLAITGPSLSPVSCSDADDCGVVVQGVSGPDLVTTVDAGQEWTTSALPAPPDALVTAAQSSAFVTPASLITCWSAASCVVVTTEADPSDVTQTVAAVDVTTDGGATRTTTTLPTGFTPEQVACPSATACVLTGSTDGAGSAMWSADGGVTWHPSAVPTGLQPLDALSCPSTSVCVVATGGPTWTSAADSAWVQSVDGGHDFAVVPSDGFGLAGSQISVTSVACSSVSTCWVSGVGRLASPSQPGVEVQAGFETGTQDGGLTWLPATLPSSVIATEEDSCPSATVCFGLGDTNGFGPRSDVWAVLDLQG